MNLEDLKQEIPYKWRSGPAGTKLAYIDARDVMDLLDRVVGPECWQDKYEFVGDKLIAGLGIKCDDGWVWKFDTGTESNIEEEKGQFSDAFKRAAVKWGVGRFLYDLKPESATQKAEPTWRDSKPTPDQLAYVDSKLRKLGYKPNTEDYKKLKAGVVSDYLGNRTDEKPVVSVLGLEEIK